MDNVIDTIFIDKVKKEKWNSRFLTLYMLFWSVAFLIATPIACNMSGETGWFLYDFYLILTSPSKLVTDYFNIGGLGSTLFNAALCGLACNLVMVVSHTKPTATTLAGYFLITAHCFYGLNFVNMWAPFCGVYVYCKVRKLKFSENVHIAMFSTALAPFISDFLFRYTIGDDYVFGEVKLTWLGIVLALLFGLATGFVVPALLPGTTKMHRAFNLFKAGLAFATGLCPFAGKYGWKVGTIAGMVNAIICTSTSALHGGFVLYNGGLTAGLTALILIPILDFYEIKEKFTDEDTE